MEIEKVAGKILQVLKEHTMKNPISENGKITKGEEISKSICYLYKHCSNNNGDEWASTLKYDVIRMLVRGSDHSHALCLHLCDGSSEFHVYSKKGWVSFCPDKDALVITIGDQIQVKFLPFAQIKKCLDTQISCIIGVVIMVSYFTIFNC